MTAAANNVTRRPTHRPNGRFSVPRVPEGVIARPRLLGRIENGVADGIVLVSGPAGSGKTLLLASWAEQRRAMPAWMTVEPEDAEPERFWSRVLQALQASPSLSPTSRLVTLHPPPRFDPRFVSFLVDVCQESGQPVVLVIEDLHQLTGTAAMSSLAAATRRGLGNLRLVISTRADPPLPLQRLRLSGQLTEIRAEDLAFDAAESVQLLAQYDLRLRPEQLQTLLARTEGWATGVRLAARALVNRDDVDQAVEELAGDHRNVADFFVEEVLDHLSPDLVQFLLDTSLTRRICADLANALTGHANGQAMLAELERDNLFVVALDDRRSWYRYHHMFADLLRNRLAAWSPERLRELNQVAASWFAEHGDTLETARHLAAAGTWGDLARFVTRSAGAQLLGVERHELVAVLERIPDWLVLHDPEVATAAAIASYGRYDVQALHAHIAEARGMLHVLPAYDAAVTDSVLTTLEAVAAWLDGDTDNETAAATAALEKLTQFTPGAFPAASAYRGKLSIMLGIGRMWSGHLDEADDVLSRTEKTFETQETVPPVLAVHLHGNLAVLRAFQGRLREAEREARIALGVAERSGWRFLPQAGMALLAQAVVALIRGEDDRCAELLESGRAALGDVHDRFALAGLAIVSARRELAVGRTAAAGAAIKKLRGGLGGWQLPWFLERWCELVELEIALAAGRTNESDARLRELADSWHAARPEAHRVVLAARAHLAAKRPEEALELLQQVTESTSVDGVPAVDAWVVSALAHDRLREDADALASLERALALAAPEGIVRPFVVSGHRLRALLERHQHVHIEHHELVQRLLARIGTEHSDAAVETLSVVEPLTNRERSVLQLLPTMMSNSEIADELSVSVNTVKVHLKSLYRKLGVKSRRQAVARARALGLLYTGATSVPA